MDPLNQPRGCDVCSKINQQCALCLLTKSLDELTSLIEGLYLADYEWFLTNLTVMANKENMMCQENLRTLTKMYREQNAQLQTALRDAKVYGEAMVAAASDFSEFKDFDELKKTVTEIPEAVRARTKVGEVAIKMGSIFKKVLALLQFERDSVAWNYLYDKILDAASLKTSQPKNQQQSWFSFPFLSKIRQDFWHWGSPAITSEAAMDQTLSENQKELDGITNAIAKIQASLPNLANFPDQTKVSMYREQVELLSQVAREMEKLREELKERNCDHVQVLLKRKITTNINKKIQDFVASIDADKKTPEGLSEGALAGAVLAEVKLYKTLTGERVSDVAKKLDESANRLLLACYNKIEKPKLRFFEKLSPNQIF